MYTLAVANQKGGVGKSSLVLALAAGLMRNGKKVLVVDFDAQGSVTSCYNASKRGVTITDVLQGKVNARQAIIHTPNGDIIAANIRLATEKPLEGKGNSILRQVIAPLQAEYDFCIIDTGPEFSERLTCALMAADGLIVPMIADVFCIEALDLFMLSYAACKKVNTSLAFLGIVVNGYDARPTVSRNNLETIKEKAAEYNVPVFKTAVRKASVVKEAQNMYNPDIFDHAPKSNASKDYWAVVNEMLGVLYNG